MRSGILRSEIPCPLCGYMLLIKEDTVFCQNRECENYMRSVKPK